MLGGGVLWYPGYQSHSVNCPQCTAVLSQNTEFTYLEKINGPYEEPWSSLRPWSEGEARYGQICMWNCIRETKSQGTVGVLKLQYQTILLKPIFLQQPTYQSLNKLFECLNSWVPNNGIQLLGPRMENSCISWTQPFPEIKKSTNMTHELIWYYKLQ